jgi:2-polyprenyl-6-methoxyphenol hydroxylase-like FAD-dependent oxidoreductase
MPNPTIATKCAIAGGGPAGMMLGYLLARAGVDVAVLEKHADFFRDFRGDTVHPSTLELMVELGLLEQFLRLPHQNKSFDLRMQTEATDLLEEGGRVVGLRARTPDGMLAIRADLVVSADGRHSTMRDRAGHAVTVHSNLAAQPARSGGLRVGSMSMFWKRFRGASTRTPKPCGSAGRRSNIPSAL